MPIFGGDAATVVTQKTVLSPEQVATLGVTGSFFVFDPTAQNPPISGPWVPVSAAYYYDGALATDAFTSPGFVEIYGNNGGQSFFITPDMGRMAVVGTGYCLFGISPTFLSGMDCTEENGLWLQGSVGPDGPDVGSLTVWVTVAVGGPAQPG